MSGWFIENPDSKLLRSHVTNDKAMVYSGKHALVVDAYNGDNQELLISSNNVPVSQYQAGTLIKSTIVFRTENLIFKYAALSETKRLQSNVKPWDIAIRPLVKIYDASGKMLSDAVWTGQFSGTHPYTQIETICTLPQGADTVQVAICIGSGIESGFFCIDGAALEVIEKLPPCRSDIVSAEVRKDSDGTPRLWINNVITTPVMYFGGGTPVNAEECSKASAAGVNIVQTTLRLPWRGTSTGNLEQVLHGNPKALILPRVMIDPPDSWMEDHPDQLIKNEQNMTTPKNRFPSLASDLYFEEVKLQFEYMIKFLKNTQFREHIIGFHPEYLASEWFYSEMGTHRVDFSDVNRQKFTKWLKIKYENISSLNKAWGKNFVAFSDAQIPRPEEVEVGDDGLFRDPANLRARAVADFQYYFNNLTSSRMIEIADVIKKLTFRKNLVAYFYGYQNELVNNGMRHGISHSGHLGMRQLLASPNIDFICAPISYYWRNGGPPMMMNIVDSISLSGKIFLEEDDSRTWIWEPAPDSLFANSLYHPTEWDTMQCLRRNFGNVIEHNQAIWWMDLLANGSLNNKSIWDNNRLLTDVYSDSIKKGLHANPEVALIYDEDTFFWLRADCYNLTGPSFYVQRYVFQSLGTQVGYYYIEDLDKIPKSIKVIVFVTTIRIDKRREAMIQAVKNGGRILVWLYAPGYVGENDLSKSRVEKISGFGLKKHDAPIVPEIAVAPNTGTFYETLAGHRFGVITQEELKGTIIYIKPLSNNKISPTFYGDEKDSDAVVLGNYSANGQRALLLKRYKDWTSVFCGAPMLSVPVLRAICKQAGVTFLMDPDKLYTEDVVQFNGQYLFVYARKNDGLRNFKIPGGPFKVKELVSDKLIEINNGEWSDSFRENEQKIYKLTKAESVEK
jgi:hypothetical protein